MNKTMLSESLAYELGFTKTEAKKIVDKIFELMSSALINGETVNITEFATFKIVDRPSKRYRNAATGQMMEKQSGMRVKVHMCDKLVRRIDPGFGEKVEVEE